LLFPILSHMSTFLNNLTTVCREYMIVTIYYPYRMTENSTFSLDTALGITGFHLWGVEIESYESRSGDTILRVKVKGVTYDYTLKHGEGKSIVLKSHTSIGNIAASIPKQEKVLYHLVEQLNVSYQKI